MPGIPNRWEVYTALGKTVKNTNFVPFKVPLKPALCRRLPAEEIFTPSHLLNMVEKLGLVIDLTNTRRYYDPDDFISNGVQYVKIFCEGHGIIPDLVIVRKFYDAVHDFLNEKKDGLIGVHCTHGLNRTGYFICRYMIENLGFNAENAIKEFNEARGHDMERVEYVKDLYEVEKKRRNATGSTTNDRKGERKCNDRPKKSKSDIYFDHTCRRQFYGQSCYSNKSVCSYSPGVNYQEETTVEAKTRGKNNSWHNCSRYNNELCKESNFYMPQKCTYRTYWHRDNKNGHNYDRPTTSQNGATSINK